MMMEPKERAEKTDKRRVLLVEDHPIVRQGLRQIIELEDDLEVCGEEATTHDAIRAIEALHPDLVLLDLALRGSSGTDVLKYIQEHWISVRTVVISSNPPEIWAEEVIRHGALGYISKDEAVDHVIHAIRSALSGNIYTPDQKPADSGHWFG
ncbi:response regulator transcription factor [Phycisphaeraceae bacterium D3-23]